MMKAIKPDKPGCWFFENTDGRVFPVIVVEKPCNFGGGIALNVVFRMRYFYLEAFENLAGFKRWIGQAHPPKEFASFLGRYFEGNNGVEDREMVLLDDVKEFRLKE